jgi:hypothetical protein
LVASLDFGQVLLAGQSQSETVVVTNTGELPTAAALAATLFPNTGSINTSGCTGSTLASLASCTLTIYVVPQATGANNGLTTTPYAQVTAAGANPTAQVGLSWTGVVAPTISSANAPGVYTDTAVLSTGGAAQSFTFSNGANSQAAGPLATVAIVDSNGNAVPDFVIQSSGTTCAIGVVLGTGGSCTVSVKFVPTSLGAKQGNLIVGAADAAHGGTPQPVSLTGNGISALSVTASSVGTIATASDGSKSLALGNVTQANGQSVMVTWTNAAGSPTTGQLTAVVSGTNAADLRITNDTCTGLQKGGGTTCTVTVLFKPSAAVAETATITVSGTPGNSAALTLTATGT